MVWYDVILEYNLSSLPSRQKFDLKCEASGQSDVIDVVFTP